MKFSYFFVLVLLFSSCKSTQSQQSKQTTSTPIIPVIDTVFNKVLVDNYRYMEDFKDSSNVKFLKTEKEKVSDYFSKIPNSKVLDSALRSWQKRRKYRFGNLTMLPNNKYLFIKRMVGQRSSELYFGDLSENDESILSEESFWTDDIHYYIDYIKPSWDGNLLAIALQHDKSFFSKLVVYDLKNKKVLSDELSGNRPGGYLGIKWLPDNSGFIYLKFDNTDDTKDNFKLFANSVVHILGQGQDKDRYIFGSKTHPQFDFKSGDRPSIKFNNQNDKYVIGYSLTVENNYEAYYIETVNLLSGNINWKPLYVLSNQVLKNINFFNGDDFYYITSINNSFYEIHKKNVITGKITTVVPAFKEEIIDNMIQTSQGIVFSTTLNGVQAKLYKLNADSTIQQLELPIDAGYIDLMNSSSKNKPFIVAVEGWATKKAYFLFEDINSKAQEIKELKGGDYSDLQDLIVETKYVESHDGAQVPLSIVRHKSVPLNGKNPTIIRAYGAYGDINTPYIASTFSTILFQGGILAIAHVRGGGEKGSVWAEQGKMKFKSNGWKDFNACSEYLIKNQYTNNNQLVAWGSSAGALLVFRGVIENPRLYTAAISQVGLLNPARSEFATHGSASNHKEFGSIFNEEQAPWLIHMDPYLALKPNMKLPDFYLATGYNDTRVSPWMSEKFMAKAIEVTNNESEVFLDLNFNTSHTSGSTEEYYYNTRRTLLYALNKAKHHSYITK